MSESPQEFAKRIDHTNVKPDATQEDIKKLCDEAVLYGFSCACVTPTNAELAVQILKDTSIKVCMVVGFPTGVQTPATKAFETKEAVDKGVDEVDMVMNIGALKSSRDDIVEKDIAGVVNTADGKIVKVILETALLTDQEKIRACLIAEAAGADYVKTSTAYGGLSGATVEDVRLMRNTVGSDVKIKAAGGIRNLETAQKMIKAGADKLGTSTGVQIIEELLRK
ncbi:MAG: deoxyribose-phosphate aldolase [Methanobacterium sp. BRmetb2]|nr:MAG: deoxyribose-phosphate aldolase [Methanobacterium sp. BRmetb2]